MFQPDRTPERRQSKQSLSFVARLATSGNRKHYYLQFSIRVRLVFSIDAYPVWTSLMLSACILHQPYENELLHQKAISRRSWYICRVFYIYVTRHAKRDELGVI